MLTRRQAKAIGRLVGDRLRAFGANRSGATVIEYGLIVGILSVAIVSSMSRIGPGIVALLKVAVDSF